MNSSIIVHFTVMVKQPAEVCQTLGLKSVLVLEVGKEMLVTGGTPLHLIDGVISEVAD